jgi:hypothetical protein
VITNQHNLLSVLECHESLDLLCLSGLIYDNFLEYYVFKSSALEGLARANDNVRVLYYSHFLSLFEELKLFELSLSQVSDSLAVKTQNFDRLNDITLSLPNFALTGAKLEVDGESFYIFEIFKSCFILFHRGKFHNVGNVHVAIIIFFSNQLLQVAVDLNVLSKPEFNMNQYLI